MVAQLQMCQAIASIADGIEEFAGIEYALISLRDALRSHPQEPYHQQSEQTAKG